MLGGRIGGEAAVWRSHVAVPLNLEGEAVYASSKAAVSSLTKILAKEGGKHKIYVNCIAPGFILTRLHTKKLKKTNNQIKNRKKLNVLNEYGSPSEITNLIKYLISDNTKFITGEIIRVDGGDWL